MQSRTSLPQSTSEMEATMRTDQPRVTFLKTTGTIAMTFSDEAPRIEWSGKFDPKVGTIVLVGRRVDPHALDRWADDGGRA